MGLTSHNSKNYINCSYGQFQKSAKEGDPGAIKKENGKYVFRFDAIENVLVTDIQITDQEYKGDKYRQWEITLWDEDDKVYHCLQMRYDSKYAMGWLKRVPNIKWNELLDLKIFLFDDENGKEVMGITVKQNGEKVPAAYSKDEPNGLPLMESATVGDKTVWDSSKMMTFLQKTVDEQVIPNLITSEELPRDVPEQAEEKIQTTVEPGVKGNPHADDVDPEDAPDDVPL